MKVRILGSAAGGGVPQWNCRCPNCAAARAGSPDVRPRTQSSVAVSAGGPAWFLLNASPDVRQQVLAFPPLGPAVDTPRCTAIAGCVLTDAEIDHVQTIEAEVPQIVMHGIAQLLFGQCRRPGFVRTAPGAHLGHDRQAFGIGMKSLPDDLVGDMGAVIVTGIDMVDPQPDSFAHHRHCRPAILRRTPRHRTCQMHGAIADPIEGEAGAGRRESAAEVTGRGHGLSRT